MANQDMRHPCLRHDIAFAARYRGTDDFQEVHTVGIDYRFIDHLTAAQSRHGTSKAQGNLPDIDLSQIDQSGFGNLRRRLA